MVCGEAGFSCNDDAGGGLETGSVGWGRDGDVVTVVVVVGVFVAARGSFGRFLLRRGTVGVGGAAGLSVTGLTTRHAIS